MGDELQSAYASMSENALAPVVELNENIPEVVAAQGDANISHSAVRNFGKSPVFFRCFDLRTARTPRTAQKYAFPKKLKNAFLLVSICVIARCRPLWP